jgi:hypothetical protein
MATTTTNFGWDIPQSTDLVKDGATAIAALGQDIDTAFVDLKGGSTGQVLAKASGTDLDYSWVTTDDTNAIQNAIVDAKGDLIAASAADTPARLAVGNNGETLVADSSTSTGLRYQGSQVAGKNLLVNGNFDIWQRGTSFANPAGYFADRFTTLASVSNITFSQQTTGAPAGSRYILRATATGASAYSTVCQMIETAQVEMLQGSTATYSVKLRVNSTFNATGLILKLQKSATADAGTGATWTDISTTSIALASLPTTAGTSTATYYQGTITAAIPSDGTANSLRVIVDFNGGSASGSIVEYSQFMLELGSVPTTFMRAGGTIQGELAACQRYYFRATPGGTYSNYGFAIAASTTIADVILALPVPMRIAPTTLDTSNIAINDGTTYYGTGAWTVPASTASPIFLTGRYTHGSAVFTAAKIYLLSNNNNVAAYFGASAEL